MNYWTQSHLLFGGYAQRGYEIISQFNPSSFNIISQARQGAAFWESVGSIAESMYNGDMNWSSLASLLGDKATDALIGDLLYLKDNYNQFSTDVEISNEQAWSLGRRTAGAIFELEQAGFTIKSLSSAIKGTTKNIKGQVCFTGDTVIPTKDGYKEIKDIKVGDEVYSENTETGEKGLRKINNTFINETKELIYVFVGNEEVKATPDHPFWVIAKGWVQASDLKVTDKLLMYDGSELEVKKLKKEQLSEPIKVYNFEVKDWHTYFVSGNKVLVHNSCNYVPKNIKMVKNDYLKKKGIDAHELKMQFVGKKNIAHYDLYVDKETGQLFVYRKGAKGEGIPTGEYIKGN